MKSLLLLFVFMLFFSSSSFAVDDHNHMMEKSHELMMSKKPMMASGEGVSVYSLSSFPMFVRAREFVLDAYQFDFYPQEIKVKKGERVRIFATSRDVKHGIYIKEFKINVPVEKGRVKVIEFTADQVGEFDILCSVYCGKGHHVMKAKLIVEK